MWKSIKALFWTTIVCLFIVMAPFLGALLTIGTIFYIVYAAVNDIEDDNNDD